jgi:hypothetical protein
VISKPFRDMNRDNISEVMQKVLNGGIKISKSCGLISVQTADYVKGYSNWHEG